MVTASVRRDHLPGIDFVKAAAILAVIGNHSVLDSWDPRATWLDELVRWAVQFHVPAFLIVSGFLYAKPGPMELATLGRRLFRILPAYLVASCLVQSAGLSRASSLSEAGFQLLTGSALPIYYYVFVLATCVLLMWPLSRLPGATLLALLAAFWVYQVVVSLWPATRFPRSLFWLGRSPTTFFGYFLIGWVARLHWGALSGRLRTHPELTRIACAVGILVYAALHVGDPELAKAGNAALRGLYTTSLVGLLLLATSQRRVPGAVRFLSESSYAIYLYHYPFIVLARPVLAHQLPPLRIGGLALAALLGSVAVCLVGRRLLGPRARSILGA